MSEKIVTHEDREALTYLNLAARGADLTPDERQLVDGLLARLGAAAEADQPPLPEGWVLLNTTRGYRALWHEDGDLYEHNMFGGGVWAKVAEIQRDRLTPLRPTVTEADVEKAGRAARAAYFDDGPDDWDAVHQGARDVWMKTTRAALDALGIEVQP